jgi:SAM-dependent methyltransferase
MEATEMANVIKKLRTLFVSYIYADHNQSHLVKREIDALFHNIKPDSFVLNIGSGNSRIHPIVKNLDIIAGENVDIVSSAEKIPLNDETVDLIITQEAFEHIADPQKSIQEAYRILKRGGVIYFQVPFIIGYHPGPADFWRFTKEGIVTFLENAGFQVEKRGVTVGSASGFYRIAVEFFAIIFSGPIDALYIPFKAVFSLIFYPIKILDHYVKYSSQNDRIAGGYFAVAKK